MSVERFVGVAEYSSIDIVFIDPNGSTEEMIETRPHLATQPFRDTPVRRQELSIRVDPVR